MKPTKLLFILFFFIQNVYAQNPMWVIPPYYLNQGVASSLPVNPDPIANDNMNPYDYYDGKSAIFSSNGIAKLDGSIKFFIVDGLIYDGSGKFLCYAWGNFDKNPFLWPNVVPNSDLTDYYVEGNGGSETLIIPHPSNCEQYIIIGSSETSSGIKKTNPAYAILDLSQEEIVLGGPWYSNYDIDNSSNIVDELINATTLWPFTTPIAGGFWSDGTMGVGSASYASTEQLSDGSRFIIACLGVRLIIIKLHPDGTLEPWNRFSIPVNNDYYGTSNLGYSRSEFELFQDPLTGNYKLAFSKINNGNCYVQIAEFSNDFTLAYTPAEVLVMPLSATSQISFVKGIEFSPNGSKLYLTTNTTDAIPSEVYVIDLSASTPSAQPLGISTSLPVEFGFIETEMNGNLFFGSPIGIYQLTNPDTPSSSNFSLSPILSLSINPTYCTYESSNQSIINRAYSLPDQIDKMDYAAHLNSSVECCLNNIGYDKITYTATATATWTPGFGSNPLDATNNGNDVITIKDELRIPAGVTITIDGMTIEFAPDAKLIIENSTGIPNGGKLILKNSTLKGNTSCAADFWQGIEVWGNQTQVQGSSTNSKQGWLTVNNSTIQDAWIAILASKRTALFTFNDNFNGGVVQVFNGSHIKNNQRGVWFRKYLIGSNLSYVNNSFMEWDDAYFTGNSIQTHATLDVVYGINFRGTVFSNDMVTNPYAKQGFGIIARQSQFYVKDFCTSITPVGVPCPSPTKCDFRNLNYGIHVTNGSDDRTYIVDNSLFNNCRYGIYTLGTKNERITSNIFAVRESNIYQTAGGALFSSTGYKIENNDFFEYDDPYVNHGAGMSYGLVINSSGTTHNEVYRNRFRNLMVGGQSEKINGLPIANSNNTLTTGLQWKCNSFGQDIYLTDLGVNGIIDYQQGYLDNSSIANARKKAARNTFSMFNEDELVYPDHDIMVYNGSQQFNYVFLDAPAHTPDNVSAAYVTLSPAQFMLGPVTPGTNDCPSQLNSKITIEKNKLMAVKTEINQIVTKIEQGSDPTLITQINSSNNFGVVKEILLGKSPFLSDNVLLAYLNSNAPASMKKDVLLANTTLSSAVLSAVQNSNLPIGTKNQIFQAQQNGSLRDAVYRDLSAKMSDYDYSYNEVVSLYLLEENDNSDLTQLKEFLAQIDDVKSHKTLYDIFITKKDFTKTLQEKNHLLSAIGNSTYFDLQTIKEELIIEPSEDAIVNSPVALTNDLDYLAQNASEEFVRSNSKSILEFRDGASDVPDFLPLISPSAMMLQQNESVEEHSVTQSKVCSIYPNPSNGQVYIDYPQNEEGIMEISVLDLNGKEVYKYVSQTKSNGELINIEILENGIYMVNISFDGTYIETHKLFISNKK